MKTQSVRSKYQGVHESFRPTSIAEKDWFKSIMVWLVLELLCFGVAPYFQWIEPGSRWQTWVIFSIPAGLIGAGLVALSSQSTDYVNSTQRTSFSKRWSLFLMQLLGGVGLAGLLFPLAMLFVEFITKASIEILQRGS